MNHLLSRLTVINGILTIVPGTTEISSDSIRLSLPSCLVREDRFLKVRATPTVTSAAGVYEETKADKVMKSWEPR